MEFGKILSNLREEKGLTQKELAKACNLSPQCISALENGARNPTGSTVVTLAQFLGCSSDYLLGLENDLGEKQYNYRSEYTHDERKMIVDFRRLDTECQKLVLETIKKLNSSKINK